MMRCAVGNSGYKRQLCKDKCISFVDMYMYSFYQTGIFVMFGGTSVKRRRLIVHVNYFRMDEINIVNLL